MDSTACTCLTQGQIITLVARKGSYDLGSFVLDNPKPKGYCNESFKKELCVDLCWSLDCSCRNCLTSSSGTASMATAGLDTSSRKIQVGFVYM